MRLPLLALALVLAACDAAPQGEPGATYPFAGDHPLIALAEVADVRPELGADLYRNVEATVGAVDPCPPADRIEGACVIDTITLAAGPSTGDEGFLLPVNSPEQFEVGARYRVTLQFHQGDDSVAVYLAGYTRL